MEQYRNPPAPLDQEFLLNQPDIVRREMDGIEQFEICFQEWIDLGIFDEEDVTIYDHFVINSDSEDDDIIEIPIELEKIPIEPVVLNLSNDEEHLVESLDNTKNGEEKIEAKEKTDSNEIQEIRIIEPDQAEMMKMPENVEVKKEKDKSKQRISKITQATEDNIEKKIDEHKTEKLLEKNPENELNRHKIKQKIEFDKSSRKKSKLLTSDCDLESDDEKRHRKKEKKHHSTSSTDNFEVENEKKSRRKVIKYSASSDSDLEREKKNRRKVIKYSASSNSDLEREKKNRRKIIKYSTSSDDSEVEREKKQRKKREKNRSPSTADEDYKKDYFKNEYDDDYYYPATKIKQEYPSVHGDYHCGICNLHLSSYVTYQSHMIGKRHKKNVDARNVAQAVARSYNPPKPTSKCPDTPPGFRRVKSFSPAKIQRVVDEKLEIPCPGLHKVLEIQAIQETSYYCTLCDAPCSANSILPHLSGFKHQLSCLKHYDFEVYDKICDKPKYVIESFIIQKLKAMERKYGRNSLKVLKEVEDSRAYERTNIPSTSSHKDYSRKMTSTSSRDWPSTSKEDVDFYEIYKSSSCPDPTKAGFYCRICLSHSNSQQMWEAHIKGKRHLANLKKAPGTAPSKSRNVPAPRGTVAKLYELLEDVDEPIVGLDQIREIQRLDIDSVSYTCFLCGGISVCESEIVDHILLLKHREKYLEKIEFPGLETLRNCYLSEHAMSSVVAQMCESVEAEEGRGRPEVYYAKNSLLKL